MIYTSGTSRRPKGVLHAHAQRLGRRPMLSRLAGASAPDDVMLHAGAFNWSYTLGVGLIDPWACGATAVLYNGPSDIDGLAEAYRAHRRDALRRRALALPADPQILRPRAGRTLRRLRHWPRRRRGAEPGDPCRLAGGDRQRTLRGVRHERMLDLRLEPRRACRSGRAAPASRSAAGASRCCRSKARDGAASRRRGRAARHPPQRSRPDARLLAPARRGRAGLCAATGSSAATSPPSTTTATSGTAAAPTT